MNPTKPQSEGMEEGMDQ